VNLEAPKEPRAEGLEAPFNDDSSSWNISRRDVGYFKALSRS
jgi:hypothetical protein